MLLPVLWKTFKHYALLWDRLNHYNLLYFAGGVAGMAAIRIGMRIHRGVAETFEHELTHILFALLTFHPVSGMNVNDYGGGNMTFRGKGNWLIALAPYFFPLASAAMMFLTVAYGRVTGLLPDWLLIGLGLAFGYDVCAFAEQIHPRQTDFKVAGYWFSLCFFTVGDFTVVRNDCGVCRTDGKRSPIFLQSAALLRQAYVLKLRASGAYFPWRKKRSAVPHGRRGRFSSYPRPCVRANGETKRCA